MAMASALTELGDVRARLDAFATFLVETLGQPRGRNRNNGPGRVIFPEGGLDDFISEGAELEDSGG
jgi:hypothetical protein